MQFNYFLWANYKLLAFWLLPKSDVHDDRVCLTPCVSSVSLLNKFIDCFFFQQSHVPRSVHCSLDSTDTTISWGNGEFVVLIKQIFSFLAIFKIRLRLSIYLPRKSWGNEQLYDVASLEENNQTRRPASTGIFFAQLQIFWSIFANG